ncbi:hypothetical protein E2C01_094611 [Portunus trituberculatus]|uniref:MADF domain-containing protein n=1 Tax=Portunus trituberculatus TaxID=210409 RepID=A0A5B7JMK9_PORTR|nr:hypothetical protein [Portunus trituberculatus]
MPVQWNSEAELALIELVRAVPSLWDTKHRDYSKKLLRKQLYKKISEKLQAAFPDLEGIDAGKINCLDLVHALKICYFTSIL